MAYSLYGCGASAIFLYMNGRWRFVTPEQFLKQAGRPDWIIREVLTSDGEMHFYGREGSGKSRIIWQLAYAIASGQGLWLDVFKIEKQGRVLWFEVDMPQDRTAVMLENAKGAGLWHPDILTLEDRYRLKFRDVWQKKMFAELNEEYEPVVVVIDAASKAGFKEVSNAEVEEYLWTFRDAFPNSGKIHINHTRRLSQFQKAKGHKNEQEGFLGGGDWARNVDSSMQLVAKYGSPDGRLEIDKLRGFWPLSSLNMVRGPYGFWDAKIKKDAKLLLATWPHCIPDFNGRSAKGVTDVCRSIAEAYSEHSEDAVRKVYYREKEQGVVYGWSDPK